MPLRNLTEVKICISHIFSWPKIDVTLEYQNSNKNRLRDSNEKNQQPLFPLFFSLPDIDNEVFRFCHRSVNLGRRRIDF